jgi:hypothetical protein
LEAKVQVSAELRWFWRETVPPGIEEWFGSGPFPAGGGLPRDDEYVVDPGQLELGLKRRGGNAAVEVKGLVAVAGSTSPEPYAGRPQIWSKWTTLALPIEQLPRIAVRKVRRLRKYDTTGAQVRELELGEEETLRNGDKALPEIGCNVELTALTFLGDGSVWQTLGFEAFGPLASVERALERTIAHLSRTPGPSLDGGRELSYVEWLSELGGRRP